MAGRDNRGGFRPLGLRLQRFSRRIIRNYITPTAPGTSSPDLPPRWSNNTSEPLVWRTTDTGIASQPASESAPERTPAAEFDAPPAPVQAPPRRAPKPRVENSIDDEVNPMLMRILDAHESQRGMPVQRKAAVSASETPSGDAPKPSSRRSGRNRMSVDYVETSTLKGDDAPKSTPTPPVQRKAEKVEEDGSDETDSEDGSMPPSGQAPPDNVVTPLQRSSDPTSAPRRTLSANDASANLADAIQRAEAPASNQAEEFDTADNNLNIPAADVPVQRKSEPNTPRSTQRPAPSVQRQPDAAADDVDVAQYNAAVDNSPQPVQRREDRTTRRDTPIQRAALPTDADAGFEAATPEAPIQRTPERRPRRTETPIQRMPDVEADAGATDSEINSEPVQRRTDTRWNAPIQRDTLPEGNLISDADAGYDPYPAASEPDAPIQRTPERRPRRTETPIQRMPDVEADAGETASEINPEPVQRRADTRWNAPIQRDTLPEGNLISDADAGYEAYSAESEPATPDAPIQRTPERRPRRTETPIQRMPDVEADAGESASEVSPEPVQRRADTRWNAPIQRDTLPEGNLISDADAGYDPYPAANEPATPERRTRRTETPIQRMPDVEADAGETASEINSEPVQRRTDTRWNAPIQRDTLPEGNLISDADAGYDPYPAANEPATPERRTRRTETPIQRMPDVEADAGETDSEINPEPVQRRADTRWNAPIQRDTLPEGNLISDADAGYEAYSAESEPAPPDAPIQRTPERRTRRTETPIQRMPDVEADAGATDSEINPEPVQRRTDTRWNAPIQRDTLPEGNLISDADAGYDPYAASAMDVPETPEQRTPPERHARPSIQRSPAPQYEETDETAQPVDNSQSDLFRALTESGWGQTNPNLPPPVSNTPIQRTPAAQPVDNSQSDLFRALTESGWGQVNPNLQMPTPPSRGLPIQRTLHDDTVAGSRWNAPLQREVEDGDQVEVPASPRPSLAQAMVEAGWADINPNIPDANATPASNTPIQRTPQPSNVAAVAPNARSDSEGASSSDPDAAFHAEALRWLNMPSNTPIARKAVNNNQGNMGTRAESSESSSGSGNGHTPPPSAPAMSNHDDQEIIRRLADEMVQRAVVVGEVSSSVESESSSGGGSMDVDVENLAQRVFKLIRQRLRVEQERRRQS